MDGGQRRRENVEGDADFERAVAEAAELMRLLLRAIAAKQPTRTPDAGPPDTLVDTSRPNASYRYVTVSAEPAATDVASASSDADRHRTVFIQFFPARRRPPPPNHVRGRTLAI